MKDQYLERLIKEIKSCGQTIIDNAEKIAGEYKYQKSLNIWIQFEDDGVPVIQVEHEFYPDDLK